MNSTEEIKSRLPVEQVVGRYVPLKKAGRVFKGICPFHNERTPSFTVNPERGIYKCFGCGEGGDIFDFTMKIEGLTFPEALRLLAEQAGVTLEEKPGFEHKEPKGPPKDRLFSLNSFVARLWHTILTQHPKAEHARAYLQGRGLTPETITKFVIGYAPMGMVTAESLRKQGFSSEEITSAGEPHRFRGRITFPITDLTGRTVGFTGRILDQSTASAQPPPKYWNTPETPLFIKSRTVFALHLAKQAIQSEDIAILAEGQMDVAMLHQAGFTNSVASSGTALTDQQLRLIGRFSRNIAFAYDGDNAGRAATKKGIELCLTEELNPYVIVIPNGKDPADCIKENLPAWEEAYLHRVPFMQWLLDELLTGQSLTPQVKKDVAREVIPWLTKIKDPIERAEWLRLTAGRLQTDEVNLQGVLNRLQGSTPSRPTEEVSQPNATSSVKLPSELALAELGASLLLSFPALTEILPAHQIDDLRRAGSTPYLDQLFAIIALARANTSTLLVSLESLPEDERKALYLRTEEVVKSYNDTGLDQARALEELSLILSRIRTSSREAVKADLARQINAAQAAGNAEQVKALFQQLKEAV